MKLAVMQPCYLPWRGYFALMKQADVFVHLDDVPLPQGRSFQTRVAIKTTQGRRWLTVPVRHESQQLIQHVLLADNTWNVKHLKTLRQELPNAAELVADVLSRPWTHLAELNITLVSRMAQQFGITQHTMRSSDMHIDGSGWNKLLNMCIALGADQYITGHGAQHYFNHDEFDRAGIQVHYMDYDLSPYPQPHGSFDPFVTALDVIEHATHPPDFIDAALVPWREFLLRNTASSCPTSVSR